MKTLLLSGFMGTGKTTVGPLVASRLGLPFVDTDDLVAREAGASIPDLWRREGEAKFREREHAVLERLLGDGTPRVVATGGGTLLARNVRHRALDRAVVVTLTSSPDEILRRVGDVSTRPNLASSDPARRIADLLELRAEAYDECHASLATDGLDPDDVAQAVAAVHGRDPVALPLGARTYVVDVVHDSPESLTDAIARIAPTSLVVVADATVRRARGAALDRALSHLALRQIEVTLPHGEEHKTLASVATVWDAALGAGVDRDTLVVAFGGGVTSDIAGFAASTLLRGVRFVAAPTTLLAMVDASVGGKTGIDHPAGKNLVGTIYQPSGVVIDTAHLMTLPVREIRAGLAEVVKIALATSADLFERLEAAGSALLDPASTALVPIIRESVALKAAVVRDDERDNGRRALLNLGHTIGHALEASTGFHKWLHGEAVALGLVRELELTAASGLTPPDLVARTEGLLRKIGLPTRATADELRSAARFVGADKKRRGAHLALPVVTSLGIADVRDFPPSALRGG
ncbi:MAG TPA: 3-dehydroquinate synthase [Polyangiaceae bacterium]|jgi:shikimate kinase/3-dehydroquinate synthase